MQEYTQYIKTIKHIGAYIAWVCACAVVLALAYPF